MNDKILLINKHSLFLILCMIFVLSCSKGKVIVGQDQTRQDSIKAARYIVAVLDTIWTTEQEPIMKRDEMLDEYGAGSREFEKYQAIYKENHAVNEQKVVEILADGWPDKEIIGDSGNRTICNVLQHSDYATREKYLPMMQKAVKDGQLTPQLLVRAEDRLATDRGEPQIYGGQMKYYPETKTFNVWPVFDPVNINKRRAAIGLGTIEDHLKDRFDFEWDLEVQIKRTEEFEKEQKHMKKQ
jgi:hypothetical protein